MEDYECSIQKLSGSIELELGNLPSKSKVLEALEELPASRLPSLFVEIISKIKSHTDLFNLFQYDDIIKIMQGKSTDYNIEVDDESPQSVVLGECKYDDDIVLYDAETRVSYSARLRELVIEGDLGFDTLEHEKGHENVLLDDLPVPRLFRGIITAIQKKINGGSYMSAIELHEVYARLCCIEDVCGDIGWHDPETVNIAFNARFLDDRMWKWYSENGPEVIDMRKVRYSINTILAARSLYEESVVSRAILLHGEWNEEGQCYPSMEDLLKGVSSEEREKLSILWRLKAQNSRIQAISIARKAVLSALSEYS